MRIRSLLLTFLLTCLASPVFAVVIGKVNVQEVLLTIKEGKTVRNKLKKEFEKKQKNLEKDKKEIEKFKTDFEKKVHILDDKKKAAAQQEFQGKLMAIQQKQEKFRGEMQQLEQKLKKPILDRIKSIIQKVSKDEKVDMTYESSTAPIMYSKNEVDLTKKVISSYDKKYK